MKKLNQTLTLLTSLIFVYCLFKQINNQSEIVYKIPIHGKVLDKNNEAIGGVKIYWFTDNPQTPSASHKSHIVVSELNPLKEIGTFQFNYPYKKALDTNVLPANLDKKPFKVPIKFYLTFHYLNQIDSLPPRPFAHEVIINPDKIVQNIDLLDDIKLTILK